MPVHRPTPSRSQSEAHQHREKRLARIKATAKARGIIDPEANQQKVHPAESRLTPWKAQEVYRPQQDPPLRQGGDNKSDLLLVQPAVTTLAPPLPLYGPQILINIGAIKSIVARDFRVAVEDIMSLSQQDLHVVPRLVGMSLALEIPCGSRKRTLDEVGKAFNRDYTSVSRARRELEERMAKDPELASRVAKLRELFQKLAGLGQSPEPHEDTI